MRIGIITNKFAPSGGMERYAQDVVRELLRQGHEITVFTKKADPALDLVPMVELILSSLLNVSSTGTPFFSNPLIF